MKEEEKKIGKKEAEEKTYSEMTKEELLKAIGTETYELNGYIVFKTSKGDYGWVTHLFEKTDKFRSVMLGNASIKGNTLLMGAWHTESDDKYVKHEKDVEALMNFLSKWDKTEYYTKIVDIGPSFLLNCKDGKNAPEEIVKKTMINLGFSKDQGEMQNVRN